MSDHAAKMALFDGLASAAKALSSGRRAEIVDVLAQGGTVAVYAGVASDATTVPVRQAMTLNARWQFVLLYLIPEQAKRNAVADINAAIEADAIGVGEARGLPLHHYPLEQTADAHAAVEAGAIGKVLVDVLD